MSFICDLSFIPVISPINYLSFAFTTILVETKIDNSYETCESPRATETLAITLASSSSSLGAILNWDYTATRVLQPALCICMTAYRLTKVSNALLTLHLRGVQFIWIGHEGVGRWGMLHELISHSSHRQVGGSGVARSFWGTFRVSRRLQLGAPIERIKMDLEGEWGQLQNLLWLLASLGYVLYKVWAKTMLRWDIQLLDAYKSRERKVNHK